MPENGELSAREFGTAFKRFLDVAVASADLPEAPLRRLLREHLGTDPSVLPVESEHLAPHELPNLQLAIDAYIDDGRTAELIGFSHDPHSSTGLSELVIAGARFGRPPEPSPVERVNVSLDEGRTLACVRSGLYLLRASDERIAVVIRGASPPFQPQLVVEAVGSTPDAGVRFLAELRRLMNSHNVYRGRVLSMRPFGHGDIEVTFMKLPAIPRDHIVLPEGVIERIERQTVGFERQSQRLLAAGRHLKRGMLLHGPPGTGKTFTAMYLAGQMQGRTIIILTGSGLQLIAAAVKMARDLYPAAVVLEDVDLVAEDRTHTPGRNGLLFELLNQMDGMADDADVVFVLTTNRADLLEPALAARPGRVDLAISIPLPDAACRARLIENYGRGLTLRISDMDRIVEQTNGVSAAFVKELLRKAALFAAEDAEGELVVEDRHIDQALLELVIEGSELDKTLHGGHSS